MLCNVHLVQTAPTTTINSQSGANVIAVRIACCCQRENVRTHICFEAGHGLQHDKSETQIHCDSTHSSSRGRPSYKTQHPATTGMQQIMRALHGIQVDCVSNTQPPKIFSTLGSLLQPAVVHKLSKSRTYWFVAYCTHAVNIIPWANACVAVLVQYLRLENQI